jgi:predicted DCC family thiol-disulfide oxidoreductase YuxK
MDRDHADHMRFCPIQSKLAQDVCTHYGMPIDVSTAVLIDGKGMAYKESNSILQMFQFMGFPFNLLGPLLLLIPAFLRDFGYRLFARNRGDIWKAVKKVTGLGETKLHAYRDRVVGLEGEEPLNPGWGFGESEKAHTK